MSSTAEVRAADALLTYAGKKRDEANAAARICARALSRGSDAYAKSWSDQWLADTADSREALATASELLDGEAA